MTDRRPPPGRELPILEEGPTVCRKLRTKLAYGDWEGTGDWRDGDSTTAAYWCLRTMETAGPDDAIAHPHTCRADRRCFAPPARATLLAALRGEGDRDA